MTELPKPSQHELDAIARATGSGAKRPARVRMKSADSTEPGVAGIGPPHSDHAGWVSQMEETLGSSSADFCGEVVRRLDPLLRAAAGKLAPDNRLNAALALLGGIAPQNELEAALGEQIVGAHVLSMDLLGRASVTDTIPKMEAFMNMATKASRTMATHVETLARLRSGGKQQVIVKHVYVNGNAVVAETIGGAFPAPGQGVEQRKIGQSHTPLLGDAIGPEVRGQDAGRHALPVAGGAAQEAMPDARRHEPRRSQGRGQRPIPHRDLHRGTDPGAQPSPRGTAVHDGSGQ